MITFIQNIFVVSRSAEPAHHPTTGQVDPIYFYESDKPYFELAKLPSASRLSPLMLGRFTPCHQVHKLL